MYTGYDINRVRKYIINTAQLGRFEALVLIDLLNIIKRDHELKKNRDRQNRYQRKNGICSDRGVE